MMCVLDILKYSINLFIYFCTNTDFIAQVLPDKLLIKGTSIQVKERGGM